MFILKNNRLCVATFIIEGSLYLFQMWNSTLHFCVPQVAHISLHDIFSPPTPSPPPQSKYKWSTYRRPAETQDPQGPVRPRWQIQRTNTNARHIGGQLKPRTPKTLWGPDDKYKTNTNAWHIGGQLKPRTPRTPWGPDDKYKEPIQMQFIDFLHSFH